MKRLHENPGTETSRENLPMFGTAGILAGGKSSQRGFDKQLLIEDDRRILETARKAGITLLGFSRENRFNIYSAFHRLKGCKFPIFPPDADQKQRKNHNIRSKYEEL